MLQAAFIDHHKTKASVQHLGNYFPPPPFLNLSSCIPQMCRTLLLPQPTTRESEANVRVNYTGKL